MVLDQRVRIIADEEALITGATKGIGHEVARQLVAKGLTS